MKTDEHIMSLSSQEIQVPSEKERKWRPGLDYTSRGILLAEWAGTALLVLLSCLPACAGMPPAARAGSAGLAVALLVQCFDHISGAILNPTVLLAAVLARRVAPGLGAAIFGAQLLGAAAGAGLLLFLAPPGINAAGSCVTLPVEGLAVYKAACIEAVLGGLLALASMAAWDPRNRLLVDSWPLRLGLSVAGLSIIAVYWVGPLSGSLACTLLYRRVWAAQGRPAARAAPEAPEAPGAPETRRAPRVSLEPAVERKLNSSI